MNAGAAMRLLLAGKTLVYEDGARLRLIGGELCIEHRHIEDGRTYEPRDMSLFVGLQEFKEYPLNFEEALEAMLDGKVVENEVEGLHLRLNPEMHMMEVLSDDTWVGYSLWPYSMTSQWKVVE